MSEANRYTEDKSCPLSVVFPVYDNCNCFLPFAHALKIAYQSGGELEIIDARDQREAAEQIGVRDLLERWGILKSHSDKSDVINAGLRVKKIVRGGKRQKIILHRLKAQFHDLVVIGYSLRYGFLRFIGQKLLGKILLENHSPVLFIPSESKSFVNIESGEAVLKTIVITADDLLSLKSALDAVRMFKKLFSAIEPEVTRVMSVNQSPLESCHYSGIVYRELIREGNRKDVLTGLADTACADLIILAGKRGNFFQSKLRILNILNLLGNLTCPLFWIPAR
jgi:hypothetical protein